MGKDDNIDLSAKVTNNRIDRTHCVKQLPVILLYLVLPVLVKTQSEGTDFVTSL